jgi:MFS family permease
MLINKFGFSHEIAPKIAALIPIASMIFMPIFGKIMDKKGKAATMVIIGSALLIVAHLSLSLMNGVFFAYFGLFALGMAFSIVPAAMWPCVPKVIDQKRLGTAFATVFTIQNWGLMGLFWGIGKVLDVSNETNLTAIRAGKMNYDYTHPILMLVGLGLIAIFFAYQLKRADKRYNYGLENPRK